MLGLVDVVEMSNLVSDELTVIRLGCASDVRILWCACSVGSRALRVHGFFWDAACKFAERSRVTRSEGWQLTRSEDSAAGRARHVQRYHCSL